MTSPSTLFIVLCPLFFCAQVITVTVDGPYEYHVTSDNSNVTFTNVRFDIQGGANFTFNLAVEEFLGTATFAGVTGLVRYLRQ